MEPTTDRELLVRFEGKLELFNSRVEDLARSINNFSNTLADIENKKINALDQRLLKVEDWKSRMAGAWVVILFLGGVITAGIIGLFRYFMI